MRRIIIIRIIVSIILLFVYTINAHSFTIDGLNYRITDESKKEVTVTGGDKSLIDITVPSTVVYNGIEYSVKSIANSAFYVEDLNNPRPLKTVTISEGVTTIGEKAFYDCCYLSTVIIPKSLEIIKYRAFWRCSSLLSISLPGVTTISEDAFEGCRNLTSVFTNGKVSTIGKHAFRYCTSLTSIDFINVSYIDEGVFQGCTSLTVVKIPNGITAIGISAFQDCTNLSSVVIPTSVTAIGTSSFYGCTSLSSISIPASVTAIGSYAFKNCKGLLSIDLPESIGKIDNYTFEGCSSLTYIDFPERLDSIGIYAFNGCEKLTSLQLPKKIIYIGMSSFNNCNKLESVVIPNSLVEIGDYSFNYCTKLSLVISEIEKPYVIQDGVFRQISPNAVLKVPIGTKELYQSNYSWSKNFSEIVEDEVLQSFTFSITTIGTGSISYEGTTIRNTTKTFTVNEGTFATVSFMPDSGYRIASVKVNNTDVTSSVSNNKYTISNIKANTTMEVAFGEEVNTVTIDNITYYLNHNEKTAEVTSGTDKYSGDVVIPATINSNGTTFSVTSIGSEAFGGCHRLTSVNIPNSVISIGELAFFGCSGLTSIIVDNGNTTYDSRGNCNAIIETSTNTLILGCMNTVIPNSVASIGSSAFYVCYGLVTVTIPNSVKSVGSSAFQGCSSLTSITIPNSVTSIGIQAFDGCSSLTSIIVDKSNTTYDSRGDCNAIIETSTNTLMLGCKNTVIPNSVAAVGFAAFRGCRGLISVTIPNSVTNIGSSAFSKCSSLTSITIPNSVTSIGSWVFSGCYNLNFFKSEIMSPFTISTNVFDGISSNATLQVPKGTKSKYQEFSGWTTHFKNIIEEGEATTYTLSITASGNGSASYNSTTVKNQTKAFTLNEGTSATVSFTPDSGYRIASVKVNNTDVTSSVTNNKYTISNITANTTIVVAFEEEVTALTVEGVNYSVVSQTEKTVNVVTGNYGQVLTVPATVTQNGKTWTVTGIGNDALKDCKELAAVIWNPSAAFTATVSNPNLLLYVKAEEYAPAAIKNVVVNGTANSITLTEAASGNNFYCPQAFTARSISYTHRYSMTTGIGESRGWETLALPFDVQNITHETKGDITPFANRKSGDAKKPFWLYELTGSGFVEAASIKAYTPYIISMPNNPQYDSQWLLSGSVTFAASNVTVSKTEDVNTVTYRDRTFVPNFVDRGEAEKLYALNVNNDYTTNESGMTEGSKFVLNMRTVHPFEAYMTTASNARQVIDVFEDMTTDIRMLGIWEQCGGDDGAVYDLQGRQVLHMTKGVYVGKKGQKYIK